ncbi:DUF3311 domain-containing protein [Natronocalculus amylovorans]|uniref:DUF3311 domain-containing protein n=1 Tax=Natronocalculus amylovorans TaxID=2917812 RepID=A0AAE3FWS2_9EURY|nr:DUF3311 domain-containing protein [Natronocalculus amylovorans]MCL9816621.1 DUF3311 domain-containing protein [Natronocalculus amylovorans]NUE01064.1 DUF3311 domain-containing protein [Halorubraceae archaeon YAN]
MADRIVDVLWVVAFALLTVFSVPWFLWGDGTVVAGLPAWLWWHIGWMVVATALFWQFTKRAWDRGMGVTNG